MTLFSAISKFLSGRNLRHQVEIDEGGLVDRFGDQEIRVGWLEVVRIYGVKIDKVTYDENFLVIMGATAAISIGELDNNFVSIVQDIRTRFPVIPADWMAPLEEGLTKVDLWPEPPSEDSHLAAR